MPPKAVKGRKKASVIKSNVKDLNIKEINKPNSTEENNDANMPSKEVNSNGLEVLKTNEKVTNGSGESYDTNVLADEKLKEKEKTKELNNNNFESQINVLSEEDLKTKTAPLKRGRKKVDPSAEDVKVLTDTVDLVSVIEDTKDNNKAEPNRKVEIFDDQNKPDSKELPVKRGRGQPLKAGELSKPYTSNANMSKITKDNDKTESDAKLKISGDKNKPEGEEIPLKRGRGRPKRGNEKITVESHGEELPAEEKVTAKRGRKKVNVPLKSDLKIIEEDAEEEELSEKTPEEKLQTVEKVPSKRGRKKADIPIEPIDSSDLNKVEEKVEVKESSNDTKEQINNENAPDVEQKMPAKRGRKKANQTLSNTDLTVKESNVDSKEPSPDTAVDALSAAVTENTIRPKNEKQKPPQPSKEASVKRKREKETAEEKDESDFNEKVLKVALHRDTAIDKMLEEQLKVTEKGGAKNIKAGSKRKKEDADSKASDVKSPKVPKNESKSKGQSKKDKMPDVTLLDFSNDSTSPSGKPWNLKISSWNVNGVRAWLEKDGLAYITHENPDIMAFQETKCSDKMLPKELNITGYHSYWLAGDKDGYSGVGLLSKKEPISVNYGIGIEEHDTEGRVITAEYETFYLVTTYIPNAGRGLVRLNYRMQWDKDFCSYIKSLDEKKPVVLCGDLNVAHEEIDLANPKSNKKNAGFTKEEREGFSTLLSQGFIDSFRHLYPEEKGAYTFWTYMMNSRAKNVGWRLDYFVLSKKFTDHLCDCVIRKDVFGSDHCPITLFLNV